MPKQTAMTVADRNELIRIVRGRFKLLNTQLHHRIAEVENIVRTNLREQFAEAMEEGDALIVELEEKARALEAEAREVQARMLKKGVSPRGSDYALVSVAVTGPFRPRNEGQWVHDEMRRVSVEASQAQSRLQERELELVEELLVGKLETKDAKKFLARVPTIETLVPAPPPKQLVK